MAKLKSVLDSLDGVDESLHGFYVERDGKHYLDAEGVEDVGGLKSALAKEKAAAKAAKEALAKYDGFDPEEFQRLKEAAEAAEAKKLEAEGNYKEIRERDAKAFAKEIEKRDAEIGRRDKFIEKLVVENELNAAIEKVGVISELKDGARALFMIKGAKVVATEDGYNGLLGDVPISDYVESWAKTDEAAHYLRPTGAGGSGTKSGKAAPSGSKPRSEMTNAEKAAFIDKHGQAAYFDLPLK